MLKNKKIGWNTTHMLTNFEVQKLIPDLTLYRNPTSCDDHQFIKEAVCILRIINYIMFSK